MGHPQKVQNYVIGTQSAHEQQAAHHVAVAHLDWSESRGDKQRMQQLMNLEHSQRVWTVMLHAPLLQQLCM